jgi:signal transduction histidine kinase
LILLTISFVIAGIFNTIGPFLLYEEIQSLEFLSLPWGEQLALAIGPEGPVLLLFLLTQLVAAAFILVACVIQYRRGERQAALALAIGMIWFIIAIVVDSLVDTGTITSIYLSDFGFLVLAITLSLQMANQVIKTEEELDQHRHNLESLVEARTAKLEEAQEQLLQQTQEQATIEERNRLARDLHDAVTQTIYSAALIAEALPQIWERSPDEGQRNLIKLRQLVRGALAEMRALLFELRPAALETVDLELLLRQQCDALTGRTRVPINLTVEGQAELPPEVKIALYRITQEAFNNIAKHAQADRVKVTLQQAADEVILTIEDNGRGFEVSAIPAERMGIQFMRERAGNIDASLEVRSQPAQGTHLAVAWSREREATR